MDRTEYDSMVNELIGEGASFEDAHFLVAKKLHDVAHTKYHRIGALWPPKTESSKVAFEGNVEEAVKIPKGAKLLLFYNKSDNPDAPTYRIVWTW